ncbi:hypothetical protein SAMIE_1004250 [Sphingobium amiense]|uniref:Uncharacterized protein n=1 Tax=Sphingobium amiense TaxID=135719 RepID=A0A494VWZ5_9SPHN|nr:hypothetical protein [Sphingobium amiense]BBD96924.1 hypothetical protein SAMIE_1004250 [Sphingobium amiense]
MNTPPLIARLARHLAKDRPDDWPGHVEAAASILAILKDADEAMREEGDLAIWQRMIDAALRERWTMRQPGADGTSPGGADEEGDMRLTPDAIGHDRADWMHIRREQETSS